MSVSTVPVHLRRNRFLQVDEISKLRTEQPIFPVGVSGESRVWLVTKHSAVRHILSDATRFGSDPHSSDGPFIRHGNLSMYDPPEHGRLRRMISSAFTARRVEKLRPRVEAIVDNVLDAMDSTAPPVDLVQSFSLTIPSMVICELLGVPYEDRNEFHIRSLRRFDATRDMEDRISDEKASLAYMAALIAAKRSDPDEALLGRLIREHGDEMTNPELVGIGDLLLLGGHETTANMLALGTLFLIENPQFAEAARADDQIDNLVEELTRYISVVQLAVPRIAREDSILEGKHIKHGDVLLCSLPSANHDEDATACAAQFNPARKRTSHLAYGHGVHYCVGAPLARMEMRIAYQGLMRRFPKIKLAVSRNRVKFRTSSVFYGLQELPVTW